MACPHRVRAGRQRTKRHLARLAILLLAPAAGALAAVPASAALPDAFGFVLWSSGSVNPGGTFPAATTVTLGPAGQFKIMFSGLGGSACL
jgi:hypothetical protein